MERWRPVVGFERQYMVSTMGRVKSLFRFAFVGSWRRSKIRSRYLKQTINSGGYYMVTLHKRDNKKTCLVHRLVADAFIEKKKKIK